MTAIAYTPDKALSYWPTPPSVAHDLVYAGLEPWMMPWGDGVRVLEPSAGEGHLAREIRAHLPSAHVTCVEPDPQRAATLRAAAGAPVCQDMHPSIALPPYEGRVADVVITTTLERYLASAELLDQRDLWEPFDLVVMNPPFTLAGHPEAWAEHVLAVYRHPCLLRSGGVISAVVPHVVRTGSSRAVRSVRDLLSNPAYGIRACERNAFAPVGAKVSTATLLIEKP